jgi:hypothetical protein
MEFAGRQEANGGLRDRQVNSESIAGQHFQPQAHR